MVTLLAIVGLVLLWLIAHRLRRIARLIETVKLTVDIPIYGERPDPEPAAQPRRQDNVVTLGRRRQ
jgi:hypothetical protein